jgi:hypothetical protein
MVKFRSRIAAAALLCFVVPALSGGARAALLFYEGFDYPLSLSWPPAGTSLGGASGTWLGAEPQPDSFGVIAGLTYPDALVISNAAGKYPGLPGAEQFASVHQNVSALQGAFSGTGTFYVSMLIRERVGMHTGDQTFNANNQRTGTGSSFNMQFESPQGGNNYLASLMVFDLSGEVQAVLDTGIPAGDTNTHMLVAKVVNDGTPADDIVSMVLDPDLSAGEPDFGSALWRIADQNITTSNVELYLKASAGGDEEQKAWDEIRIGTTWDDVVPPTETPFSLVTVDPVAAVSFPSVGGFRYRLQIATNIVSAEWADAEYEITGNSDDLIAYDPVGTAGARAYRLSVEPPAFAGTRYLKWQQNRPFTLGTWYGDSIFGPGHGKDGVIFPVPPPLTPFPSMVTFQEAGLNCLIDNTIANGGHDHYPGVSNAQAAGVPFMVRTPGDWGSPWDFDTFQNFVQYLTDDPAWSLLCGIQVADEPHGEDGLTDVEAAQSYGLRRDWLVANYPHLLITVGEAMGQGDQYLHSFHRGLLNNIVSYIRPDAILFQFYPAHWTSSEPGWVPGDLHRNYYVALDYASEFCKTHGIGFWSYPQTAFRSAPYSDSTLRLEKFAAIAYGVTGFEDFGYDLNTLWPTRDQEQGYVKVVNDGSGSGDMHVKTTAFPVHAQINTEISRLGNVLVTLRHVRTYHVNAVPDWDDGSFTWNTHLFSEADGLRTGQLQGVGSPGNNLMVGFFQDGFSVESFMVVNKNHDPQLPGTDPALQETVTLTLAPGVAGVRRINRATGAEQFLPADMNREVTFDLPGGTGDLFFYEI